jgi:hypothetical protein
LPRSAGLSVGTTRAAFTPRYAYRKVLITAATDRGMKQSSKECVMRTKVYSVLLSLGLAATTLAKAGVADSPTASSPNTELVIDAGSRKSELHFSLPTAPASSWDIPNATATAFGAHEFTELGLALSSPGLFFGVPGEFFRLRVHFGSRATTAVVFPDLLK